MCSNSLHKLVNSFCEQIHKTRRKNKVQQKMNIQQQKRMCTEWEYLTMFTNEYTETQTETTKEEELKQ